MPGPACLVQKPMVFAQEARHLRRRGTSLCLAFTRTVYYFGSNRITSCAQPDPLEEESGR
jgi:hypothetical protein